MADATPPRVPMFKVVQIAAAVRANPNTVRRYLDGYPVAGAVGYAIAEEVARRGIQRASAPPTSKLRRSAGRPRAARA